MQWVLWLFFTAGPSGLTIVREPHETKALCEAAAEDIGHVSLIRERLKLAQRGHTVFAYDHACTRRASQVHVSD